MNEGPLTDAQKSAVAWARKVFCYSDVEIDDDIGPEDVSEGEDGLWVRAWVWVPKEVYE